MGDMIITGRSPVERLENLEQVLKRLERYGLKATKKRLSLWKTVLNFVVDAEGPQNTSKKIEAVLTPPPPEPKHVSELRAFLWLVNYYAYGRFIENVSLHSAPLYDLLKEDF